MVYNLKTITGACKLNTDLYAHLKKEKENRHIYAQIYYENLSHLKTVMIWIEVICIYSTHIYYG